MSNGDQGRMVRLTGLAGEIDTLGRVCDVEALRLRAEAFLDLLQSSPGEIPVSVYRPALEGMKCARAFTELARTCDRLSRLGQGSPYVRTLHAQALIELRQIMVAIPLLEGIVAQTTPGDADRLEAFGLLGRAYKQLYVDEQRVPRAEFASRHLLKSIESYALGLADGKPENATWHAINVAALAARAERDKVQLQSPIKTGDFTRFLIETLTPRAEALANSELDVWVPGVIGGAYLTEGDFQKAAYWYGRYARQPAIDAFKLIGTIRQLEEVYEIKPGVGEAGIILASLKARASRLRTGHATFEAADIAALTGLAETDKLLEAVLGTKAPSEIRWLKTGLERAASVATVVRRLTGKPHGTGFLVRGKDLWKTLGDELFLLTNHHVLSDPPHSRAIRPQEALVTFDEGSDGKTYLCEEVVWTSPVEELDASLIRLKTPVEGLTPLPIAHDELMPESMLESASRAHAYIIGRPEGQLLSISLHDSELIDIGFKYAARPHHTYLHYKTPTKPGNSGSPVFDETRWEVIGLHHMGPPPSGGNRKLHGKDGFNTPANEGIAIRSIRRQIAEDNPKV
jgi:hypothetical protein